MIYLPQENRSFVLVPKNASSSIRKLFQDNFNSIRIKINNNDHVDVQQVIDGGFLSFDVNFYGIIRNPLERQLSLYLYRHREKRYNTNLTIDDFRKKISLGYIKDHPWQMQLQSSFMKYNGINIGTWYTFEKINDLFFPYGNLDTINKSSNKNTIDLLNIFYDNKTRNVVENHWAEDFALYEKIKNENR